MSCDIVIRVARPEDTAARAELVHRGFASHRWEAFILFFFQELTLQLCVLGGAVLFIFCGVSVAGLGALLPAAAAAVALSVLLAHQVLADKHVQNMRKEMIGFIAELRGPLMVNPATASPTIVRETEQQGEEPGRTMYHSQLVGTVSVAEFWGPRRSGWMQALAVHPDWRRRGIGRALAAAVRGWALCQGLESLECIASELQPHVRALTHQAGWEVRGWYHRRLLGAALTLLVAHLGLDLPHA